MFQFHKDMSESVVSYIKYAFFSVPGSSLVLPMRSDFGLVVHVRFILNDVYSLIQ
jgi:hypothetical protein